MYEKVSHALHTRGGLVLMTVRYIPGARMVATLTAGATAYSFRKFIVFTIAGVTIAYTYVALLGGRSYICGPTTFVETVANHLVALGEQPAHIRTERFGGG